MLNNKKAFTLIEALAVLAIIAIIAVIATPNVLKIMKNDKAKQFRYDANQMISKTKYYYKFEDNRVGGDNPIFTIDGACQVIKFEDLKTINATSPYSGEEYNTTLSTVKVCLNVDTYVYSVKLRTASYCLGACDTYVLEADLEDTDIIEN